MAKTACQEYCTFSEANDRIPSRKASVYVSKYVKTCSENRNPDSLSNTVHERLNRGKNNYACLIRSFLEDIVAMLSFQ